MEKKEQWYYSEKGKAMGPVSKDQIMELLSRGQLKTTDLIFKDGADQWQKIHDCFVLEKKTTSAPAQEVNSLMVVPKEQHTLASEWIILTKKVVGKETRFVQLGPFTTDEVKFKIIKFEVTFDDHVWKEGFERWKRISEVADFDQRELKINSSNQKDLENVVEQQIGEPTEVELDPQESTVFFNVVEPLESESKKFEPLNLPPSEKKELHFVMPPPFEHYKKTRSREDDEWDDKTLVSAESEKPLQLGIEESSHIAPDEEISSAPLPEHYEALTGLHKTRRSRGVWLAMAVLVLGLCGMYFFALKNPTILQTLEARLNLKLTEVPTPVAVATPVPIPIASPISRTVPTVSEPSLLEEKNNQVAVEETPSQKNSSKPVAKEVEPPKIKEPKNLELKMEDLTDLRNARLKFSMDVPSGTPMSIRIQGKTGEVLRHVAFDKKLNLKKEKGPLTLKLSEHSLGEGKYWVEAKIGAVFLRRSFFYGQNNNDFQKELTEHRKFISYDQQQERQQLIKTLRVFQKNAEEFVKSSRKGKVNLAQWNKTFKKLNNDQLKQLDASLNYLAYAPLWEALKGIQGKLLDVTAGSDPKEKRIPANEIGKEILSDLTKLKTNTTQYSIFKNYKED